MIEFTNITFSLNLASILTSNIYIYSNNGYFSKMTDKDTGISVGQHSLVITAKKAFWQLKPPIPRYHATYNVSVVLRYIESLGENENLSNKQLSEKTAFLVAFSTLSRYGLVPHLTKMSFPSPFLSLFSLTVLLRMSSISV